MRRLLPLLLLPLAGCADPAASSTWPADKPGPKVVASFPPLWCFAANVGGPDVSVRTAMTHAGPHDFDPTADDMKRVQRADLFLMVGLGLDDRAAKKLKDGSRNFDLKLIDLGAKLDPKLLEEGQCTHDHHGHDHDHGMDPHVWLGPDLAVKLVDGIRDEFAAADPARADGYRTRAAAYTDALNKLLADGRDMLKGKTDRKLVASHEALTYFARAFDLSVPAVIATQPGREPTGKELDALVAACVKNKVRVIAVEPQYAGNKTAERIADELRRKGVADPAVVEIDPLETAREADLSPGWYEAKMRQNLAALAGALK
jgi:ABC-type Zn uptake system ZnuABC Zn-binding protein ZnuA